MLVVTAIGAEAGVVGTAGGSRYPGVVLAPPLCGVEHTSRETRLRESRICRWRGRGYPSDSVGLAVRANEALELEDVPMTASLEEVPAPDLLLGPGSGKPPPVASPETCGVYGGGLGASGGEVE